MLLLLAGMIAAMGIIGAQEAAAQTPRPGTVDPATPELAVRGWVRGVASTGTTYYQCQTSPCGPGSTISVRRQAPSETTPEKVEARDRAVDRVMAQRFGPAVRITRGDLQVERVQGGIVIGRATQDYDGIRPAEGMHPAWTSGFVSGPCAAYSIGSSAAARPLADRNFTMFLSELKRFVGCGGNG